MPTNLGIQTPAGLTREQLNEPESLKPGNLLERDHCVVCQPRTKNTPAVRVIEAGNRPIRHTSSETARANIRQ